VATLESDAETHVDRAGDVYVRGVRVTRAGGWIRIAVEEARMPATLRWISVHVVVTASDNGAQIVWIDRVRLGDIVWDSVDEFHDIFDHVWAPHLRERTLHALQSKVE
jgi:hypothetical protein